MREAVTQLVGESEYMSPCEYGSVLVSLFKQLPNLFFHALFVIPTCYEILDKGNDGVTAY
jgi:hypothetical protein